MKITFNDLNLTELCKVISVSKNVLPNRSNNETVIPQKHGSYYGGYRYEKKQIQVEILIERNINENLRKLAWLLDVENPSPLIFSDEPYKFYYAVLDGVSQISKSIVMYKGVLTFVCYDPFAYSTVDKTFNFKNKVAMIENDGTTSALPKFNIKFNDDCGYVAIISPNGIVQVGNPKEVDGHTVPKNEYAINEPMENHDRLIMLNNPKTQTSGVTFKGSIGMNKNGTGIAVNGYETSSTQNNWHGPEFKYNLPVMSDGTKTAQYFEAKFTFEFTADDGSSKTSDTKQVGRIEFIIKDDSNNIICSFLMRDSYSGYEFNIPAFFVGSKQVWEDEPTIPKPKKVKQYNKTKKKWETKNVYPTHIGKWNDFYGKVIMRKSDKMFYFEIQKINKATGKVERRATKTYHDKANTYGNRKASTASIWMGKYAKKPELGKMSINHLTFLKHNTINWLDTENLFTKGDELVIDCEDSKVYLNEALFMEGLDIGSEFFEVEEGMTEIRLAHSNYAAIQSATVTITERYL